MSFEDMGVLLDTFASQPLDFYGALRAATYDGQIRTWIREDVVGADLTDEDANMAELSRRLVNRYGQACVGGPAQGGNLDCIAAETSMQLQAYCHLSGWRPCVLAGISEHWVAWMRNRWGCRSHVRTLLERPKPRAMRSIADLRCALAGSGCPASSRCHCSWRRCWRRGGAWRRSRSTSTPSGSARSTCGVPARCSPASSGSPASPNAHARRGLLATHAW